MFGHIKTKLLLIPAKETPNMGSKEFDCPMALLHKSNDLTAKCRSLSRKFCGEMTLLASAFAKAMKIRSFLLFVFMFIFQGHMKVALIQLSPVPLLQHSHNCSLSSGDAAVLNKLLKKPLLGGSGVSITRNKEPWFSVSILN